MGGGIPAGEAAAVSRKGHAQVARRRIADFAARQRRAQGSDVGSGTKSVRFLTPPEAPP